jgi:hypothetical protein
MSRDDPTRVIQNASSFSKQLTSAAQRAGFTNITVHDARRESLVKANGKLPYLSRVVFS